MFQSLSGFQVRCNKAPGCSAKGRRIRFNPYRVFKFVATLRSQWSWRQWKPFQSLSGFQVRCNSGIEIVPDVVYRSFNPYRVFKFVATYLTAGPNSRTWSRFQSLSGFQVRCNKVTHCYRFGYPEVSIPIGFSSSLQPQKAPTSESLFLSFNPYRVFKFVATGSEPLSWPASSQFQSLSGFQVRCNCPFENWQKAMGEVSIPIGFSSSLQRLARVPDVDIEIGFNPYRVFKFVATATSRASRWWSPTFQSLSGFQVRCNA